MAMITVTTTSTVGSEFYLPAYLLGVDNYAPITNTNSVYRVASPVQILGRDVEIEFISTNADLEYDALTPSQIIAGTINTVVIHIEGVGEVEATGYAIDAVQLWNYLSSNITNLHSILILNHDFTFTGNDGADVFKADNGFDTLSGGKGDDILYGGSIDDTLNGGQGNDQLYGGDDKDTLNGDEDEDELDGGTGDDILSGGDGDDTLIGGVGQDELYGNDGDDILAGGNGDKIDGGDGFDTVDYSKAGSAITLNLPGVSTNDELIDIEKVIGSAFDDILQANAFDITLFGGAGNDKIIGSAGSNTINGGVGADELDGGAGQDFLSYEADTAGVTITLGAPGVLTIGKGGDAAGDKVKNFEHIFGGNGNDKLTGNASDNTIVGGLGNDTIFGLAGNDRLVGISGKNTLDGGVGNDRIQGGSDEDTLIGGAGIDLLDYDLSNAAVTVTLGAGNAVTVGQSGHAQGDKISQFENFHGSNFDDAVTGSTGNNVFFSSQGADKITGGGGVDWVNYGGSGGAVTVNLGNNINTGEQAEGDTIFGVANVTGSSGDDTITGNTVANIIEGGQGADKLSGGSAIESNTFDIVSYAGSSAVTVDLTLATEQSGGDAEGDLLSNFEGIIGSQFGDTLIGNTAANMLDGSGGDDNIKAGAGADKIDGGAGIDGLSYEGSVEGVTVSLGVNGAQTIGSKGDAQGDIIKNIENLFGSEHADKFTGNNLTNRIDGLDGDDVIDGGAGNDTLIGGNGIDTIQGGSGNDEILGGADGDTIDGGANNDSIAGGLGEDTIQGSAGDDTVEGGAGADKMDGGAGLDWLSYNTSVAGITVALAAANVNGIGSGAGSDADGDQFKNFEHVLGSEHADKITGNTLANIIEGGDGDDILDGGAGIDTVSYALAATKVTVTLGEPGVESQNNGVLGENDKLVNFENITGSAFNDALTGNSQINILKGGDGIDTLKGGAGNDQLLGGDANDILFGGAGVDVLDGGAGFDQVNYSDISSDKSIILTLGKAGAATMTGGTKGSDFIGDTVKNIEAIVGGKGNDVLTGNELANEIYGGDGDDLVQGGAGADALYGGTDSTDTSVNDTVSYASSKSDVLVVLALGQLTQVGGEPSGEKIMGFEHVIGGSGNDSLFGGLINSADNTVNHISGGAGNDVIQGYGGADILEGGTGIDTLSYFYEGTGVTVTLKGKAAADVSTNAANHATGDVANGFESLLGGFGNDTLTGDDGANVIDGGGSGNDKLNGGAGNDTVSYFRSNSGAGVTVTLGINGSFTSGNGTFGFDDDLIENFENIIGTGLQDKLTGNNLVNKLYGGNGNDTLIGGGGADLLDGGIGFDTVNYLLAPADKSITVTFGTVDGTAKVTGTFSDANGDQFVGIEEVMGGKGNDVLRGNAFANSLFGGDGDDLIEGGADGDTLNGADGIDTVSYEKSNAGVSVNLGLGAASGGHATGDTLHNFENIIGSNFNDVFAGTAVSNVMTGNGGSDYFNADDAADTYNGGAGSDTIDYSNWNNLEITLTLGANGALTTATANGMNASIAQGDKISLIENVTGGLGNDKLIGNALNNEINGYLGDDYIDGGLGNDVLNGGGGAFDTLSYVSVSAGVTVSLKLGNVQQNTGGGGIDTILNFTNLIGTKANDRLIGSENVNTIQGGEGNDTIIGGLSADKLEGGDGIDTVSYELLDFQSGVNVDLAIQDGATGQFSSATDAGNDILSGFENLTGSLLVDELRGDAGVNTIKGLDGNDLIEGRGGADILDGGSGVDTLSYASDMLGVTVTLGTNGVQTKVTGVTGSHGSGDKVSNFENIIGGVGNDRLIGNASDNEISGGDGDDYIDGGQGNDTLSGDDGIDTLSYASATGGVTVDMTNVSFQNTVGAGNDFINVATFEILLGSAKNDHLSGYNGFTRIDGGDGNDTIMSYGTLELLGGKGNDLFVVAALKQVIDGGAGVDTVSYALMGNPVTVDLNLDGEQNVGLAGTHTLVGIENLIGGFSNDILIGDGNANRLEGGQGSDKLTGGLGNDTFVYNSSIDGGDNIIDFGTGADKIQVSKAGFGIPATVALNGSGMNNFGAEYFVSGSGAVATKAHGQFVFDTDTFQLFWDEDGTGGNAAVAIAEFDNNHNLLASNFVLI
jgi:Ca2+-binding RTX toxin-like protein